MQSVHFDARAFGAALHDAAALVLACVAATLLLESRTLPDITGDLLAVFVAAIPIQIAINFLFGIYQGIWRYTSLPDIQRIIFAVLAGTVCISVALHGTGIEPAFGYREYILYPVFLVAIMSASRMAYRSFKEWALYGRGEQGAPVIVMGAGDAAVGLVKDLSRSHEWRVVGFLDDDEKKRGRLLHGVRVLGTLEDLPRFAQRLKLRHAIIAMPSVPYAVRRHVVGVCKRANVTIMTVPTLNDLPGGKGGAARIRKVAVEDLMKRDPVMLDDAGLHDLLTGQVVHGDRGGRLDRLGALPPDRGLPARRARALRGERIRDVQGRRAAARAVSGARGRERDRRHQERAPREPGRCTSSPPRSSSTPRHTSTCRSWRRRTPGRRCRTTCSGTYVLARAAIEHAA